MLLNKTIIEVKRKDDMDFIELEGLQEVPELGVDPEKVEITTLSDPHKKYEMGIGDLGDLDFVFLYDNKTENSNYRILKELEANKEVATYKLTYPDNTSHEFDAYVSVKLAGGGVNTPATFTASMIIQSDIVTTNPA